MVIRKKAVKTTRIYASGIGEYYLDALKIEAALKQRTEPIEAGSLICAKLKEREDYRNKMVQYIADKRGLTYAEMRDQLLAGDSLTDEELEEIKD
jgi:hypothetical protein